MSEAIKDHSNKFESSLKSQRLQEEHKVVAKGTIWGLLGLSSMKLISFVYLVIIARLLSPEDVGTFYLALSILSSIALVSDLGFSSAFSRYVPYFLGKKEDEKVHALLGGGYVLSALLSLLFTIILFFSASAISTILKNPELEKPLQIFSLYLIISCFFSLNNLFLQGRKKILESNTIINVQNLLKLFFTIAILFFVERSAVSLVLAFISSFAVALLLSFWYMRGEIKKIKWSVLLHEFSKYSLLYKEVIIFGLTLSLVASLYALVGYTDRILLSYLLPSTESAAAIGVYTVAASLAALVTLFPSAISSIFLPVISELHGKEKKDEMLNVSNTATRWVLFLMTPFALIFIIFPDNILQAFYGSAYISGATVLAIFTLGTFVRFLAYAHGYLLAAARLVKIELTIALFAAIVNVILNFLFIPIYGIEGAAIASAISLSIVAVLLVYYTKKLFGFTFPHNFYKPLFAGVLALAFIFLVKGFVLELIFSVSDVSLISNEVVNLAVNKLIKLVILGVLFIFSCAVYAIALVLLKAFAKEDFALFSAGLRKARVPNEFVLFAERMMNAD